MTPAHLATLHAALDAAYAAEAAKNAAIAAQKAKNDALDARIAKCCARTGDAEVIGIIFDQYEGEKLVECYAVSEGEFDSLIRNNIDLDCQIVRDEIAGVNEDDDDLFAKVANLHIESFDSEYSQKDWFDQLKDYITALDY